MMCCPLSGSDGDGPSVFDQSTPRAAKEHSCSECGKPIERGQRYELAKGLWDGSWSTYRTCLLCAEIRDHFACNGFYYGQLWEDLRENFFPDMRAGGPCMSGLTVAARLKLIDERMEWYFAQDEIDDERWDGDAWRPDAPRATRPAQAFHPPSYALLEIEPCAELSCQVATYVGFARRGGLSEDETRVAYSSLEQVEQKIREAEHWCAKRSWYSARHRESVIPDGEPVRGERVFGEARR